MTLQPRSDKYGSAPAAHEQVIEVPADLSVNLMSPFNNDRSSAVALMQERVHQVWLNDTCLRSQGRANREAFDTWEICRRGSQLKNYDMPAYAVSTYAIDIQVPSWQLARGRLVLHCLSTTTTQQHKFASDVWQYNSSPKNIDPFVISYLYDWLSFAEHKRRYFDKYC